MSIFPSYRFTYPGVPDHIETYPTHALAIQNQEHGGFAVWAEDNKYFRAPFEFILRDILWGSTRSVARVMTIYLHAFQQVSPEEESALLQIDWNECPPLERPVVLDGGGEVFDPTLGTVLGILPGVELIEPIGAI